MSPNLSFCYAALLKTSPAISAQLELLPDERRAEIAALMKELGALPAAEIRLRWKKLRKHEAEATVRECIRRYGREFRNFSPRLQNWLAQAF